MKTTHSILAAGLIALSLSACSTTGDSAGTSTGNTSADTMSGSSGPGATGFGQGVPRTEQNAEAVGRPLDAGAVDQSERTRARVSDTTVDPAANTQ